MVKLRIAVVYLIFGLVSIVFLLIYILGAIRYLSDNDGNKCDMTYMVKQPPYVRIKLDHAIKKSYPNYGLYAYGEGPVTDKLRNMKFTGIPVLFIPGNAGSPEQVQSLASMSLRMSRKQHTPFHFNYFTVDLAGEYSAFEGRFLEKQARFVIKSVDRILSLYRGKIEKVVLIGHSMGGVVAKRALLCDKSSKKIQASILITLATPHTPQFVLDPYVSENYDIMHKKAADFKKMETTIIAVGGGARDLMVTSKQIIDPNADLNILTTAVPHLWKSVDHLSILRCKQLVLAIVRALFDSVDVEDQNPHIYNSSQERLRAFNYHLTSKFAGEYLEHYEDEITFDKAGEWIEISKPQFIFKSSKDENDKEKTSDSWTFLMIPIFQEFTDVSIDAIDLESKDWLFLCSASSLNATKICQSGLNISNRTKLFPTNKNNVRKGIDLDLKEFRLNSELTHIVVRIPDKSSESSIIHIDSYFKESRTMQIDGPSFFSFSRIFSIILPFNKNIILKNDEGTLRHFVRLGIHDVVSFELRTVSPQKFENNDENFEHAMIELIESEKTQNSTFISQICLLSTKDIGQINDFRIQTNAPATMKITLRPNYSYEIQISQGRITDRFAIFVRDRWFRMHPVFVSICLLAMSIRLDLGFLRTRTTISITLLLIFLLKMDLEAIVAFGCFHLFTLATYCTFLFFRYSIYDYAGQFLTRVSVIWFALLPIIIILIARYAPFILVFMTTFFVTSDYDILAIVIFIFIFLITYFYMYKYNIEPSIMASCRCMITRFYKFVQEIIKNVIVSLHKCDADVCIKILNDLILCTIWILGLLPIFLRQEIWVILYYKGKTYDYENSLVYEDSTMLSLYFTLMQNWDHLDLVIISKNSMINWIHFIGVNLHRINGWFLLIIAATKDPWKYQSAVSLALHVSALYISAVALFKRYYGASNHVKTETTNERKDTSNAKLTIN